ncbi:histidine--tRNA ligase [Alicyclobacillus curvatus]|nr:histidine--tRNA ligase [Alicyclobacillus curvatus]
MLTQRPRGTEDILPGVVEHWQKLEASVREVCRLYNFREIRTPVFEHTELFARGVGETTDIVEKEMYTFMDRGNRSLTLRPEGTAGVVRAYVENKLYGNADAVKLYYIGAMFRYEKPQKGRDRQFHQYGCEVLGSEDPAVDAEVIALNLDILDNLGVKNVAVELNSVGCSVCRPLHKEEMIRRLRPVADRLCADCQSRLERNPLRIFDCKNESCQALLREFEAPTIIDSLCDDCRNHFDSVQSALTTMDVKFHLNPHLVRGLDYYTRTAWEYVADGYSSLGGGGRYNSLVAQVGGPETPGIGFAGGIERVLMVLEAQALGAKQEPQLDLYVVGVDEAGKRAAVTLLQKARQHGFTADRDYLGRSVKAQFKAADRLKARYVAVLGESEVEAERVALKHLATGEQVELTWDDAIHQLSKGV